jgi:hypothetical protein
LTIVAFVGIRLIRAVPVTCVRTAIVVESFDVADGLDVHGHVLLRRLGHVHGLRAAGKATSRPPRPPRLRPPPGTAVGALLPDGCEQLAASIDSVMSRVSDETVEASHVLGYGMRKIDVYGFARAAPCIYKPLTFLSVR